MTNGDKIRSMANEELACFLTECQAEVLRGLEGKIFMKGFADSAKDDTVRTWLDILRNEDDTID